MFVDEFGNDDILFFTEKSGIAINIAKDRLLIFKKVSIWFDEEFSLTDIRGTTEVIYQANELAVTGGRRDAKTVLAVAFSNSRENTKAQNSTGVQLSLRSTKTPNVFLNAPDNDKRASLMEAIRQALEGTSINCPTPCTAV
jgi:hypothetical protein